MSLRKAWVITCDHDGCTNLDIFDPIPYGEKAEYGIAANDRDWDAAPGRTTTYCHEHNRVPE